MTDPLAALLWEELRFVKGATDDVIVRLAARLRERGVTVGDAMREPDGGWETFIGDEAEVERLRLATPPPPRLDSERLARALHATAPRNHNIGEGPLRAICVHSEAHEDRAAAIAAAYEADGARLIERDDQ